MLHRGGEAEGPDRRTPAERPPSRRDPGEDKVPAHPAQSPADAQRLLQVFPGHPAPVSGGGGRRGSAVLLTLAANIDSQGHSKPHVNDGALTWSACKGGISRRSTERSRGVIFFFNATGWRESWIQRRRRGGKM